MLTTRPLMPGSPFGVEVTGLDLSRPVSDADIRALIAIFYRHQVIRIPRQEMELADFARFGSWFGKAHEHVVEKGRVDGFPDMSVLTNEDDERRNAAAFWHTDNTYETQPATATMLWSRVTPAEGGETMVADMYRAYDALPQSMKQRIDGLKTMNGWYRREDEAFVKKELPVLSAARMAELSVATHPLALRHPVTGRKCLYSVTGSSFGIEGMPLDEGLALLKELAAHALQREFTMPVGYAVGDIAAWDTMATLHSATPHRSPAEGAQWLRRMYRISVKGMSPYAQPAAPHEAAKAQPAIA